MVNYFVLCQISATSVNCRNKETVTKYNACCLMHFNLEDFFNSVDFIGLKLWAWKTKTVFSDKKKIHMYWFEIDKHDYSTIISKVQGAKQIVGDAKKFELEWADCMKKNKWNKYNLIVPKNTNICISVDTIILLLGFYYRRSNLVYWNCLIWFYAITIIWFDNYRLI